uniref:Uncharacterized protein n=1 Tax=Zea mays TaxID=4577 RepID=A0A804QXB9_MAIZE
SFTPTACVVCGLISLTLTLSLGDVYAECPGILQAQVAAALRQVPRSSFVPSPATTTASIADGFVGAGAIGVGDRRGIVLFLSSLGRGVRHGLAVRRVQVPASQVPAGLRVRALLPTGQPAEVRARAPRLRREQRDQADERNPPVAARGRHELARLRGRHANSRPRLRLRGRHLHPPAQPTAAPAGPRPRQVRALQVPGGSGGSIRVDGADRAAGDGRVHRQRDAERRRAQLHQPWTLGGARLPRRLHRHVRAAGAVRQQRADAVQELRRRRAHREDRDEQRRLRVRLLERDDDGRVCRRCLWRPRDARHQQPAVLEVWNRRRRREAQRRSVGGSIRVTDPSIHPSIHQSCQVTDAMKKRGGKKYP